MSKKISSANLTPNRMSLLWIISLFVGAIGVGTLVMSSAYIHQSVAHEHDSLKSQMASFRQYVSPATLQRTSMKSSVDYTSCCGLGHRMSKMVDAYYISRVRNFGLRIFWGFCGETTEIFHHFFGPQPLEELESVTSMFWSLKINNESPCFRRIKRTGSNETDCPCPTTYLEESAKFYKGLVQRFREKSQVEGFRKRHDFDNHLVVGLHVRAGNGEVGDFVKKHRNIPDTQDWVKSISNTLVTLVKEVSLTQEKILAPLLFIATDTGLIVTEFRESLKGKISVIEYEQERLAYGRGVSFGEMGGGTELGAEDCLSSWKNPLMDMMILASTDIVVAGRPSSVTQSLPMSVVLARSTDQRRAQSPYCEISSDGSAYQCFDNARDWCCRGMTNFHLGGIRGYEFRRMPQPNFDAECNTSSLLIRRPGYSDDFAPTIRNQQARTSFLPYDWDWVDRSNKPKPMIDG